MSEKEKRVIEGYEERACLRIGGGEIILAEKRDAELPFMVCNCSWDNPFGVDTFSNAVAGDDYLEAFREFIGRAEQRVVDLETERAERGVPLDMFTEKHCTKDGMNENMDGKVVVIKPESLSPEYRVGSHQLMLCTGGNGSRPEARGRAVFCTSLYTGKSTRWDRVDVAGVLDPDKMPEWAQQKLAALERKEKTSIRDQIKSGQQKAAHSDKPTTPKKDEPAL